MKIHRRIFDLPGDNIGRDSGYLETTSDLAFVCLLKHFLLELILQFLDLQIPTFNLMLVLCLLRSDSQNSLVQLISLPSPILEGLFGFEFLRCNLVA